MYTVIFLRERSQEQYNGAIHVECFETEKEVRNFIRFKTFSQERSDSDANRYFGDRHYYGDYGFLVLKDGETVYNSNFDCSMDEVEVPVWSDNRIDCYEDRAAGVNQNARLNGIFHALEKVEKEYNESLQSYREEVKKQAEIAKEKALLKTLLEKYPDMK